MEISTSETFSVKVFGAVGLIIFAFFGWLGTAGVSFGASLLLIIVLFHLKSFYQEMKQQPLFWLSVLAVIYLILHWWLYTPVDELAAKYSDDHTMGLIYLWLFSVFAWHLRDRQELMYWMIGLASVGLIIRVLMRTDWADLEVFLEQRQGFGLSIVGFGLHSGLAIWGLLLASSAVIRRSQGFIRWTVAIVTLLGGLILVEALLLSQSRTGWVSTLVAVVFTVLFLLAREGNIFRAISLRKWLLPGFIAVMVIIGIFAFNYNKITGRLADESDTYSTLLSFDREQIPYQSVGRRAHMWLYGYELWQQKPFFGWGVGMSRPLLALDEGLRDEDHPHFHNNYMELLVEQGIVGFMFYALAFALLMHGLQRAYTAHAIGKDIFYYLVGAWSMVLIWSMADSRMVHADMRFVLLLLTGIAFAAILRRDAKQTDD